MPLIPVALIAVGAITGSGGLALGGKGAWDLKKAQEEFGKSKCDYERRRKRSEVRVELTNKRLEHLGERVCCTAIANGDGQTVTAVLNSIVDIAKQSPIAELGDLSEVRALLRDPDTVWEI